VNQNPIDSGRPLLATLVGIVSIAVATSRPGTALSGDTASVVTETDVTLLDSESEELIGRGYYQVSRSGSSETIVGENRYLDGESDQEVDHLNLSENGDAILESYSHKFLSADGTPQSIDTLNVMTGVATCTSFRGNERSVREMNLTVSQDTYAGSAQLLALSRRLNQGVREITMHSFICFPGPRVVPVKATAVAQTRTWPAQRPDLLNVGISLDLGWFTHLIDRFTPAAIGLFDPDDDFSYVGGTFDRFYRRKHVTMQCRRRAVRSVGLSDTKASN